MKMIEARAADRKKVNHFLLNNESINAEQLLDKGFVVEMNDAITGCYVIESIDKQTYWLKQLYMNQEEIFSLPLLIEAIIKRAEQQEVTKIYVHSHQQVVDQLLHTLEFYPQEDPVHVHQGQISGGRWWAYEVHP